jgi:hypothetical protein
VADGRLSVPQDAPSVEIARAVLKLVASPVSPTPACDHGRQRLQDDEWAVDHWFGQHPLTGKNNTVTDPADALGGAIGGVFLGV